MNFPQTLIRQKLFFALLYFCEGAPIGFIWWTLPTQLRAAGIPINRITLLTSMLVLPWALKFLWAPLIDSLQNSRWNLRSWIIISQLTMCITLLPLAFLEFSDHYGFIVAALLLHTLSAATQDVAIDALCISTVDRNHQGSMNGWMQVGMLGGRSLFGGVALIVAATFGMTWIITGMIVIITVVTLLVFTMEFPRQNGTSTIRSTISVIRIIARRRSTWYGLLFAVIGGFAFESVGSVAGPFFVDRGFDQGTIGIFFSFFSVSAMMLGALAGGRISDAVGKQRSVVIMTLFIAAVVFGLSLADIFSFTRIQFVLFTIMTILYFGIGLFTSSSYALFMAVTDKRLGATQFSTYMGATNLCEAIAAATAGAMIMRFDYASAFIFAAIISIIAIPLVTKIEIDSEAQLTSQ